MAAVPARVEIHEEGPREGFQIEPPGFSIADRAALVEALADSGLRQIQVASFVSPTRVPQMADAAELFAAIRRKPGVRYTALWLNEQGFDRARATAAVDLAGTLYFYASDAFSRQNNGRGAAEHAQAQRGWVERYRAEGLPIESAYLMTAFGCNLEGAISEKRLAESLRFIAQLQADEGFRLPALYLADTVGWAEPRMIRRRIDLVRAILPAFAWACTCTTRAGWPWPMRWPRSSTAWTCSTRQWPGWVAARSAAMRTAAPRATSAPRTWRSCANRWASPPASTCRACSKPRAGRAHHRPAAGRQADAQRLAQGQLQAAPP